MEILLARFQSRFEQVEDRISKVEDKIMEIIEFNGQKFKTLEE